MNNENKHYHLTENQRDKLSTEQSPDVSCLALLRWSPPYWRYKVGMGWPSPNGCLEALEAGAWRAWKRAETTSFSLDKWKMSNQSIIKHFSIQAANKDLIDEFPWIGQIGLFLYFWQGWQVMADQKSCGFLSYHLGHTSTSIVELRYIYIYTYTVIIYARLIHACFPQLEEVKHDPEGTSRSPISEGTETPTFTSQW